MVQPVPLNTTLKKTKFRQIEIQTSFRQIKISPIVNFQLIAKY